MKELAIAYVTTADAVFPVAIARPVVIRAGASRLRLEILMASGYRKNASILPTPLDAFIAMLIERSEVVPEIFVCSRNGIALAHGSKSKRQVSQSSRMKLVLMRLKWVSID